MFPVPDCQPTLTPLQPLKVTVNTLYTVECSDEDELERMQNEVIVASPIFSIVTKETRNKSHSGRSVSWLRYDAVTASIGVRRSEVALPGSCRQTLLTYSMEQGPS
jgi:hypothetical protein